jgi:DNA invertase Pin-like site-specific DNA recombinase
MLRQLQKGQAHGVIMHKIDRGARNLRDWADLAALLDNGIDVHFANESTDLRSRGGRLCGHSGSGRRWITSGTCAKRR